MRIPFLPLPVRRLLARGEPTACRRKARIGESLGGNRFVGSTCLFDAAGVGLPTLRRRMEEAGQTQV